MISKLWLSGFILGVSLFTPISSYTLGIDFYDVAFPDAQVAVKITACYEGAFVAFQLLCHFLDARLPISRAARIEIRHIAVSCLMVFIIIWDRVIIGTGSDTAPPHALGILLAAVTVNGVLDGLAVGAVFGEAAILGPSSAHALVAGTAGVMPILAVLRIILKAALPPTTKGLRLSIVLYFATAAVVLLAGLAVYCLVVLPAITELEFGAKSMKHAEELGVLTLVPTVTFGSRRRHDSADASRDKDSNAGTCTDQIGDARSAVSKVASGYSSHSLRSRLSNIHTAYSLPSSMRGTSLIVRRVHTGLQTDLLRSATAEGAVSLMERTGTLDSRTTGPHSLGSHLLFGPAGRPRSELPTYAPQQQQQQQLQLQRQMTPHPHAVHAVHASALAAAASCGVSSAVLTGVTDTILEEDAEGEDATWRSSAILEQQQEHEAAMLTREAQTAAENAASNDQSQQDVEATGPAPSAQHTSPFSHMARQALQSGKSTQSMAGGASGLTEARLGQRKQQQGSGWPTISSKDLRATSRSGVVLNVMQSMLSKARSSRDVTPQYMVPGQSVWLSNWLVAKGNFWYMLGTILTYACNYGIFPAFISYIHYAPLGTWYSLLLVTTYGVGDLTGKLLPLWRPAKPQATIMAVAIARLALFFTAVAVALLFGAGPYVFFPLVFILSLSGWYEAMIFSLACEGHHPDDAYAVESLLAIQLDAGIAVGSVLSLAWGAGPWAAGTAGAAPAHG